MVDINSINFDFDKDLLEISYNINEKAEKEYRWDELALILKRIPGEYVILYDTGSIWDAGTEEKYIFDTFSQTPIFQLNTNDDDGGEHIFSVMELDEYGPISCREYVERLNNLLVGIKPKNLLVEYLHLVVMKSSMIDY